MSETAYDRAMGTKIAIQHSEQRATSPKKVAQKLVRDWCGRASGFGIAIDPMDAARLAELVEMIVIAERNTPDR